MNRAARLVLILALILVLAVALFFFLVLTPRVTKVGVFYYVWYPTHWNNSLHLEWNHVDTPVLDNYSSAEELVIQQHFDWMKDAGIDFAILSWWGMENSDLQGTDAAVKEIFRVASENASWIKLVIMVEGFNENGTYDFKAIYDYIDATYYEKYPNLFLTVNGRPLVAWWNAPMTTGNLTNPKPENIRAIRSDSRFEARIIGHNSYVDWYGWVPSPTDDSVVPSVWNRSCCIEPRYDNSFILNRSETNDTFVRDQDYSEGLYEQQWNKAIEYSRNGQIDFILIYSWNEYHERSQIEPCVDRTSAHINQSYFLLDMTRKNIDILRERTS